MTFTAKDVAALRAKTGCGIMDCKRALTKADGDTGKAIDLLREKGLATAVKKSGRIAAEGMAYAAVNEAGDTGVVIEVNAETDFVARNAEFQGLVKTCAETILENKPADLDALLKCKASGCNETVDALLKEKIQKIGENIKIRRFNYMEGVLGTYIHAGGKIAVLAKFDTNAETAAKPEFKEYAEDICMQIAASNPKYLNKEKVPASVVEHEKGILKKQIIESGKPENIAEKIVIGRLNKFYKEICLLDQPFIKEDKISVDKYTEDVAKKLGGKIKIVEFLRYEKSEGLEKRQDNFAKEISDMLK